jgi:hypothetical protein
MVKPNGRYRASSPVGERGSYWPPNFVADRFVRGWPAEKSAHAPHTVRSRMTAASLEAKFGSRQLRNGSGPWVYARVLP